MYTSNLKDKRPRQSRSVEYPLRAGDREERTGVFQHVYKRPVEYLAKSWMFTEGRLRAIES